MSGELEVGSVELWSKSSGFPIKIKSRRDLFRHSQLPTPNSKLLYKFQFLRVGRMVLFDFPPSNFNFLLPIGKRSGMCYNKEGK